MADTDILLTIGLETRDAEQDAVTLQKEVERIFNSRKGVQSPALMAIQKQLKQNIIQSQELRARLQELTDIRLDFEEFTELGENITEIESELQPLAGMLEEIESRIIDEPLVNIEGIEGPRSLREIRDTMGQLDNAIQDTEGEIHNLQMQINSVPEGESIMYQGAQISYEEAQQRIQELSASLAGMRSDYDTLSAAESNFLNSDAYQNMTVEIDGQQKSLASVNAEYSELNTHLSELKARRDELAQRSPSILNAEEMQKIDAEIDKTKQRIDRLNDSTRVLVARHKQAGGSGVSTFSRIHSVVDKLRAGVLKITSGFKSLFSRIRSGSKSAQKSFSSSLKTFLGYAIGIRSIYALFSKLRSVMKEGFTNLYKQNSKFKSSVNDLKDSLTAMKNSFAAAFQPIVSMAIPYIQKLVDWVTQLMNQIAKFNAAITGQKYYMKAIKKTGEAAEKANKQLAGFDKLNVIQQDTGSGKFEEIPIDGEKIDLLEKFREVVAGLEAVGGKFGTIIRDSLNGIPWDKIQEVANLISEGMGNFINGLVRVEGLGESIGKTFAEIGNTWVGAQQTFFDTVEWEEVGNFFGETLQGFVDNFGWEEYGKLWATKLNSVAETIKGFTDSFEGLSLGISLGDMLNEFMGDLDWTTIQDAAHGLAEDLIGIINGFIEETDWGLVGKTLTEAITSLFDFVFDFIMGFDAEGLGDAIADFIFGVDWGKLAAELGLILFGLVEKAIELLFGFVASISEHLAEFFHEIGWDGVAGLFEGIAKNLRTSVQWLKDAFNKYIVKPVKDFFGIHSPSTLFADFGKMIIQGLVNGIKNAIALVVAILNTLKTKFTDAFTAIKTSVVNIVKALWEAVKKPINAVIGGFEFLANKVIDAINLMIDALNNLSFDVPDWIPIIGGNTFGFNIPNLNSISIPRLAQGAVIPPNKEFMAVLGDQKNGTNIETPLDTMKQAFMEAMQSAGISGNQEIILQLDGREFMRAMVKQNNQYKKQTGGVSAFA